jgi:hypothetical protein
MDHYHCQWRTPSNAQIPRPGEEGIDGTTVLQGCLILTINTTFIKFSTAAYQFPLSLRVFSGEWPFGTVRARASKWNWCHGPSTIEMKFKPHGRTTTLVNIRSMVIYRWWDSEEECSQYPLVHRNEVPCCKGGLNCTQPTENVDYWNSPQSIAVCTRLVYHYVQVCKA